MNADPEILTLPENRPGFWKRLTSRRYFYLLGAFMLPALLMLLSYAVFWLTALGSPSVLVLDLNAQYVYFFGALRRILHGDANLFYSFSRALGGEFLGIFAYYLASPLSFLVALFPESMMTEALLVILLLKCGLCGVTFAYYLDAHGIGVKPLRILFGTLYALCGYGVIYQHNTMWMDCMALLPLIALGIERLIEKRKFLLFTVSMAVAVFSNFYIGYMLCIFCFIYFFYAYFCATENRTKERAHFVRSLLRMGFFSAIALGLAACILLPTYYSLGFGKTTFQTTTYTEKLKFDALDFVRKFLFISYDTVRPEGLPIVYCGILPLLLFPLYFEAKRVPLRKKIGTAALLILFYLSFCIDAVDKFWHGMQMPNWLNYRYSFLFVFVLLVAASQALSEVRRFSASRISAVLFGWMILLFVLQKVCEPKQQNGLQTFAWVFGSLLLFLIYTAALSLFRSRIYRPAAYAVLTLFVCTELLASGYASLLCLHADVTFTKRKTYRNDLEKYADCVDYILQSDTGFYRFDKTEHLSIDMPMTLGIRGVTHSTSTLNKETINLLHNMGIASKSHWSKYLGATEPFDALFGIKYVITASADTVPDAYTLYYEGEKASVYQNPNALPVAFAVNGAVRDVHLTYPKDYKDAVKNGDYAPFTAYDTPPERYNALFAAMLGKDEPVEVFKPIGGVSEKEVGLDYTPVSEGHVKYTPDGKSAYFSYTLNAERDGEVWLYLPTNYPREMTLNVNGQSKGTALGNNTDRMLLLGDFSAGEEIRVTLTPTEDAVYLRSGRHDLFWQIDEDVWEDTADALAENPYTVSDWREDRFTGTVTMTADRGMVFTTIPYDANWQVTANGKAVETYEVLDSLIAFDLAPGTYTLSIRYVPRQFLLGCGISACSLALLLAAWFLSKRKKKIPAVKGEEEMSETEDTPALSAPENPENQETTGDTPCSTT